MPFTKSETVDNITFENISEVLKSGDEEGVYFCQVVLNHNDGFPSQKVLYCARSNDYAYTGRWVYQQIQDGNFDGEITQLQPLEDPVTREIFVYKEQPVTQGTTPA